MNKVTFSFLFALLCVVAQAQTVKTVGGVGANYTSLKEAFDAINTGSITGNLVLQLSGNSTESSGANSVYSLLESGNALGANYTSVLIYPTADNVTVEGSTNANLKLTLNGADNVTIDGRKRDASGTVLGNDMHLSISGSAGNLLTLSNAATSNTIKYCKLTANASGDNIIYINTDVLGGCDNNTFEYNNIGATDVTITRYGLTTATATSGNEIDNLQLKNNNFFNCIRQDANGYFLFVGPYTRNFVVSDNSFYLTTPISITNTNAYRVISMAAQNSSGHVIEKNCIGGSASQGAGTMQINKSVSNTQLTLDIIYVNKSVANETKVIVRNNTIKNIQIGANVNSTYTLKGILGVGNTSSDPVINEIDGNFIHSIDVLSDANFTGIHTGTNGDFATTNNVISLITNGTGIIAGITEDCNSANNKRYTYNNTVYIGGTTNSSKNSMCYQYLQNTASVRKIKNNVFVNTRSNSGAGKNYAIFYNTTASAVEADYNLYFVSGTKGTLARVNTTDITAFPIITGDDGNSSVANPGLSISTPTVLADYRSNIPEIAGGASDFSVSKDIEDVSRSAVQKGAFYVSDITTVDNNVASQKNYETYINSQNELVIRTAEKLSYSIYNVAGQAVMSGVAENNLTTIGGLKAGIYVVKIGYSANRIVLK